MCTSIIFLRMSMKVQQQTTKLMDLQIMIWKRFSMRCLQSYRRMRWMATQTAPNEMKVYTVQTVRMSATPAGLMGMILYVRGPTAA